MRISNQYEKKHVKQTWWSEKNQADIENIKEHKSYPGKDPTSPLLPQLNDLGAESKWIIQKDTDSGNP